jgi:hypothetical protein
MKVVRQTPAELVVDLPSMRKLREDLTRFYDPAVSQPAVTP